MKKFKDQIQVIFRNTKVIHSPALGENIYFNAKGINHLLYKGNRSGRDENRIKTNIRLLPRAIKLLTISTVYQEESCYVKNKTKYQFWAFEGVIEKRRIKAIIRQVGKGRKHFWSVIPAWRKDRFGVVNAKRRSLEA